MLNTPQGNSISADLSDTLIDITIIHNVDMVVASTEKIYSRYIGNNDVNSNRGQVFPYTWTTKIIGKNSNGDVIFIKNLPDSRNRPKELPDAIHLEDVII